MDKRTIIAMAMAGILIATAGLMSIPAPPKIELNTNYIDLGDIDPDKGERAETFYLKNTGGIPLEIKYVSTSCGCTKAEVESNAIPPGGETKLTVTYDPSTHPGLTGKIKRVVYIQSNDPLNEEIQLELTGNALPSAKKNNGGLKDFEVAPQDVYSAINNGEQMKVIDVREETEYDAEHLKDAILLPLEKINQQELDKLGIKKDDKIVVYCNAGVRSAKAYEILTSLGYTNVKSMGGGIVQWSNSGLPTER